jgi:MoaA/NifB/PqqE/SkfB family radical SAM enzyme
MEYNKQIRRVGEVNYKQFGYSETQRFHWDILYICNYHCKYCYARAEKDEWNKISLKPVINEVINKLDNIKKPLEIILLGGEPSLHPQYFEILERLWNFGDKLWVLGCITNGSFKNPEEFVKKHLKYKDKFHFNVTFHPTEVSPDEIIKILTIINNYGFKLNVNTMLVHEQYNDEIVKVLQFCRDNNIKSYFNVLFSTTEVDYYNKTQSYKEWLMKINDEFGDVKELIYINNDKEQPMNDIDVYVNDCANFEGWKCKNTNFQIAVDSTDFQRFCTWETLSVDEINNNDDYITCPLSQCMCQGKLTDEKIQPTDKN